MEHARAPQRFGHQGGPRVMLPAITIVLAMLLSACGSLSTTAAATAQTSTGLSPACPPGQTAPAIVANPAPAHTVISVLAQTSPAGRSPVTQEARMAAISTVVAVAEADHARIIADRISSGAAGGQLAANLTLVGTGPNALFRQTNLACTAAAARTALNGLAAASSQPSGVDVLAGLTTLAQHLHGFPRRTTDVVLLGNLMATTGALNVASGTALTHPNATLNKLASSGLLPDCRGWQVYAIGGGTGTTLGDQQQAALRRLYQGLFARCGGKLVVWDTNLVTFPASSVQIPPLATTAPAPRTTAAGIVLTLPAAEFATGRAVLLPAATPALVADLAIISRYPNAKISSTGYSDSIRDAAPGGNALLSLRRADAVSAWLEAHGIAAGRITSSGAGATDFVASNSTAQGRQANRRVEILIRTH